MRITDFATCFIIDISQSKAEQPKQPHLKIFKGTEDDASLKTGTTHINGWNTLRVKTLPTVMPASTSVSPLQVIQYLHLKRGSNIEKWQPSKMGDF